MTSLLLLKVFIAELLRNLGELSGGEWIFNDACTAPKATIFVCLALHNKDKDVPGIRELPLKRKSREKAGSGKFGLLGLVLLVSHCTRADINMNQHRIFA